MPYVQASLASQRLSHWFPTLVAEGPPDGTLAVTRGTLRRTFQLQGGLLRSSASTDPAEHLGATLARLGLLPAEQAAEAYAAAEQARVSLGAYLLERGLLTRSPLVFALEHRAREGFLDAYGWETGTVEFTPGEVTPGGIVELALDPVQLHREALASERLRVTFQKHFPDSEARLAVFREAAVEGLGEREEALLALAEKGASVGELLASHPAGARPASATLLELKRRGALMVAPTSGPRVGEVTGPEELISLARAFLDTGRPAAAAALANEALSRAPVREASELLVRAEEALGEALRRALPELEGQIEVTPLPSPAPESLTPDDLYVHSRLLAGNLQETLCSAPMGEVAAARCLGRLVTAGVVNPAPAARTALKDVLSLPASV